MTFNRIHKIGVALFFCSLVPAFVIANWRHESHLQRIDAQIAKEHGLHQSTDKLIANCKKNADTGVTSYDANHRICEQGIQTHERTSQALEALALEKQHNDRDWYRNFFLSLIFFNFLGFVIYRVNILLGMPSFDRKT